MFAKSRNMVVQLADKFPRALWVDRSPFWGQLRACSGSSRLNSRWGADSFANWKLDDNGGRGWRRQERQGVAQRVSFTPEKEQNDRPSTVRSRSPTWINQRENIHARTRSEQKADRDYTRARFPSAILRLLTRSDLHRYKNFQHFEPRNFLCDQSEMPLAEPLSPRVRLENGIPSEIWLVRFDRADLSSGKCIRERERRRNCTDWNQNNFRESNFRYCELGKDTLIRNQNDCDGKTSAMYCSCHFSICDVTIKEILIEKFLFLQTYYTVLFLILIFYIIFVRIHIRVKRIIYNYFVSMEKNMKIALEKCMIMQNFCQKNIV